jgi:NAD-dependent SIR2 family protein deacetylase
MITIDSSQASGLPSLLHVLRDRRVVGLAGAGCSTESGMADV